jgi:hypothetical protein
MSAVVTPRRWASLPVALVLTSLALLAFTGCGEEEEVDPYVYAPLGAVMDGDTLSVGFLFEIDAPEFEFVRGPVAMIRKGNRLEFLVGDDMENRYPNLQGALLGVRKVFTPQPTHLLLQRIKKNGQVVEDSLPKPEYTLPKLLRSGAVDLETPGAPLPDMEWRRKQTIEQFLPEEEGDDLLQVQSGIETFVQAPRHDLPDSVRANPREEDLAWYAIFPDATVLIEDLTPGAEWMLHLLLAKDLPLVGTFAMKEIYDWSLRRQEIDEQLGHVVGAMKIIWFRYGNTFVEGSARG